MQFRRALAIAIALALLFAAFAVVDGTDRNVLRATLVSAALFAFFRAVGLFSSWPRTVVGAGIAAALYWLAPAAIGTGAEADVRLAMGVLVAVLIGILVAYLRQGHSDNSTRHPQG